MESSPVSCTILLILRAIYCSENYFLGKIERIALAEDSLLFSPKWQVICFGNSGEVCRREIRLDDFVNPIDIDAVKAASEHFRIGQEISLKHFLEIPRIKQDDFIEMSLVLW